MTFIYALLDPRTGAIRYIGKTDKPTKRLRDHIKDGKGANTLKAKWIKSMLAKGLRPILQVIDEVSQADWQAAEVAYIIFYKEEGCKLVNGTVGGDGFGGGENHPCFGKALPAERRKRISDSLYGTNKTLTRRKAEPLPPMLTHPPKDYGIVCE